MAKSLRDNWENQYSRHQGFDVMGDKGIHLNFKMKSVVAFNLTNQSAKRIGVNS